MELLTTGSHNLRHRAASEIAERALIGAVLLNAIAVFESIERIVTSADFGNSELAAVFGVLEDMHATKQPIDDPTVVAVLLKRKGVLDCVGGLGGLAKAANEAFPHHAVYYATQIRQYAKVRCARESAIAILALCEEDDVKLTQIAAIASAKLLGLTSAMELLNCMKAGVTWKS